MTALAVGAPLAIQAMDHEQSGTYAAGESSRDQTVPYSDSASVDTGNSRLGDSPSGIGGITAESDSKAKAQSLSPKSAAVTEPTLAESPTTDTTVATSLSTVAETTTTVAPTTGSSAASSTSSTAGASSSSSSSSTSTTAASTTTTAKATTTTKASTTSSSTSSSTTAATVAPTSSSAAQAVTS